MKSLLNDRLDYYPITTPVSYTPRLFHLSSSTGWFRAIEETHIACPEDMSLVPDHFPFIKQYQRPRRVNRDGGGAKKQKEGLNKFQ